MTGTPRIEELQEALEQAEARAASAEAELRSMRAELNHRVRNILAIIRSIARRSAASGSSVEEYQMHLDGRLAALGRIQGALIRDPGGGLDLEDIIVNELAAFDAHRSAARLSGPRVRLNSRASELVGLAVHELATNAVKFGALASPLGRITISWDRDEGGPAPSLRIEWQETGGPAPAAGDRPRGFGTELLQQAIAYELAGATLLDFSASGLVCRISLPLSQCHAG